MEAEEMETLEEAKDAALGDIATRMSEHVTIGRYGAFMTSDKTSQGYYIVHWCSIPYTLQDDFELDDYDPPIILKAGELVCNGEYMNLMPCTKLWYTQPPVPIRTKI